MEDLENMPTIQRFVKDFVIPGGQPLLLTKNARMPLLCTGPVEFPEGNPIQQGGELHSFTATRIDQKFTTPFTVVVRTRQLPTAFYDDKQHSMDLIKHFQPPHHA